MKTLTILFFIFFTITIFGDEKKVAECSYSEFSATAEVIKIERTTQSIRQKNGKPFYSGVEILFKLNTIDKIEDKEALKFISMEYIFKLNNGWYPGDRYISKYGIRVGKKYSGILFIKKSGVCDKNVMFKLVELNGGDYFESYQIKKPIIKEPIMVKKPVIYLYPQNDVEVEVKIDEKGGKLIHTYPKYIDGWRVFVKKDGTIISKDNGKEYYSLYWEAQQNHQYDMSDGFMVKGEDIADFLDEKLEILGLNRREANEFIIYWLPLLESNVWNHIKFVGDEYNSDYPLHIEPSPDSIIRVYMVFKGLDKPDFTIKEQKLTPTKREGFSVIEWGGSQY